MDAVKYDFTDRKKFNEQHRDLQPELKQVALAVATTDQTFSCGVCGFPVTAATVAAHIANLLEVRQV